MRFQVVRGPVECGPFSLHEGDNYIGRAPECEVCLPSKKVSRRHAVAHLSGDRIVVKDLESHNGVVDGDGRRVAVLPLPPGGKLQIGDFLLVLDAPGGLYATPDEDELDLDSGDDLDDLDLDEPVPLPVKPKPPRLPPDPGATGVSPLARPSMPPPTHLLPPRAQERQPPRAPAAPPPPSPDRASLAPPVQSPEPPVRKVSADEIRIGGLDEGPRSPPAAKKVSADEIRIGGLDDGPPPAAKKVSADEIRIGGLDDGPPPAPKKVSADEIRIGGLDDGPRSPPPAKKVSADEIRIGGLDDGPPPAPAKKVDPNEIRIGGLDDDPPPAKKVDPNEIRIRGLDDEAPARASKDRPAREPKDRPAREPAARPARESGPARTPNKEPASARSLPPTPAAEAAGRPLDSRPSVPRPREVERPPAPLPRFEPVEVPSTGVPWALQAFVLFGLLWAVVVCAPLGGLFSQKWAADARLDAATEAFAYQVGITLAERNAQALVDGDRTQLDLSFATSVEGVVEARVADARGMVLAPEEKYRISLGSREVFQRALAELESAQAPAGGSTVEIVVPSRRTVNGEIVGWAFLVVDLEKLGRATAAPWWWWIPSAAVVLVVTVLSFVIPWFLFLRPLAALAASVEKAATGTGTVRPTARLRPLERIAFAFNGVLVQARSGRE